jgi:hypothetical protein
MCNYVNSFPYRLECIPNTSTLLAHSSASDVTAFLGSDCPTSPVIESHYSPSPSLSIMPFER